MIQLNPPLPFVTDKGKSCTAIMALDYGLDYETLFLCVMEETRELWWVRQSELRAVENVTMGRTSRA